MQQLHVRLQEGNYVRHCRVWETLVLLPTPLPSSTREQVRAASCSPTRQVHTHAGDRDRGAGSGLLSALWKEEGRERETGKAKYRLVQALKAVIRLAAAVAHLGRLAGKGTSFIQCVGG